MKSIGTISHIIEEGDIIFMKKIYEIPGRDRHCFQNFLGGIGERFSVIH